MEFDAIDVGLVSDNDVKLSTKDLFYKVAGLITQNVLNLNYAFSKKVLILFIILGTLVTWNLMAAETCDFDPTALKKWPIF